MKSCECFVLIREAGYKVPIADCLDSADKESKSYLLALASKDGRQHALSLRFCPFCGNVLHDISEESVDRKRKQGIEVRIGTVERKEG